MKYYFLETDERNKIPYAINKNHAFDIRHGIYRRNIGAKMAYEYFMGEL